MESTTTKIAINTLEASAFLFGVTVLTWENMQLLMYLMLIDFATGILKGICNHGFREGFKSEMALKGIVKKACIWSVPLIVLMMGEATTIDVSHFSYGLFSLIVFAEGYSIFENMRSIGEGRDIKKIDFFSVIMNKVSIITDRLMTSQNLDEGKDSDKKL